MSRREWSIRLQVTDFGAWCPSDERQAAALIRVVNELRRPQDGKPRVEAWTGRRCLSGTIDADSFTLDPGEHLVRTTLPDGSEGWGGMGEDLLAKLDGPR